MRRTAGLVLTLASLLASCGGSPGAQEEADASTLVPAMASIHPDLFHGITEETLTEQAGKAARARGSREKQIVEIMRVVASVSREDGRDGHTRVIPGPQPDGALSWYPLQVWEFKEGVYVTAARKPYEDLAGGRITAIGDTKIEDALKLIEPLVPRDNDATVRAFRPAFLINAETLMGLDLASDKGVTLSLIVRGAPRTVTVKAVSQKDYGEWAGIAWEGDYMPWLPPMKGLIVTNRTDQRVWTRMIGNRVGYLRLRAMTHPGDRVAALINELMKKRPRRFVVDLRGNPGGDNSNIPPILRRLSQLDINRNGFFFVLTDRSTFSAAAQLAAELKNKTKARLVGETPGGAATMFGDTRPIRMTRTGITVHVAAKRWDWPGSPERVIEPAVPVEMTAFDYFTGNDPVLARTA